MATEIEHKYLVKDDSYKSRSVRVTHISQGYLCTDRDRTVRVRIADNRAFLTIKGSGNGVARPEFEYEIPLSDAQQLMALCLPSVVNKTRHIVPDGGNRWEVDEYHGKLGGLVTAELELPDERHSYPLPSFLGRDVTGDPRYSNAALSRQGLPDDENGKEN